METLYRKYRPLDFDTVVGQDSIVTTLRNQIKEGSIAHAYLFSGTRGTGKTTIAKIFARAINCPNELNGNPCNECATCVQSIEGNNMNILELDAASNSGVDNIRRITEQLDYPPQNGEKYKVFIIDEAHALSQSAVQAFLKTLEEPPEYVVFILATTDPNKLPETILSRCQKYNFRRINIETIVSYLKKVCSEEKIEIEDDALIFIAEKSDGSMRESLSILDRVRAYSRNDAFTKEKVLDILGIVDDDDFSILANAINNSDIEKAFNLLSDCLEKGKDITQFTNDFLWYLRNLLIAKDLSMPVEALNLTKTNFDKLKKESESFAKDVLIYYIEELSRTANLMKYDENRRVILETTLIRLASPETNYIESAVMARIKKLEENKGKMTYAVMPDRVSTDKKNESESDNASLSSEDDKKIKEIKLSPATFKDANALIENWKVIISSIGLTMRAVLSDSKIIPVGEKELKYVEVQISNEMYNILFENNKPIELEEKLTESIEKIINKKIEIRIVSEQDSKYSKDVLWKKEDAYDKIDMEIEEE
ncbi:MAG: DNA polymerase III subunit gamma/tau [Lachnospiraceae bacterium]|nr:DNA polymerase III subunit gamma/tau [Lachnospiraceae bacterium]